MKRRIIFAAISALSLAGAVWGAWCSRPNGSDNEHQKRIEAQTSLHRAETDLEIPRVTEEAQDSTQETLQDLNKGVHDAVCDPDLAGAVNDALR